jgi:hypothetical protein
LRQRNSKAAAAGNHEKLTFHFQGRDYRLADVSGQVVTGLLA